MVTYARKPPLRKLPEGDAEAAQERGYFMKKPRIAVPEINQDVRPYVQALYAVGLEPILISVRCEQIEYNYQQEYLDYEDFDPSAYDGLLIPGGWDVAPWRYGQDNHGAMEIREDLDQLQFEVLDAFISRRRPVMGICRGHQLINVYFGGTLIQNLETSWRHAHDYDEPERQHGCSAREGSWLAGLHGRSFPINSSHHQALDRPGHGIIYDGWCLEDGAVEAMHHETLPVIGTQFHPERMCLAFEREDTVSGLPILSYFSRLCGGKPEEFEKKDDDQIMQESMGI